MARMIFPFQSRKSKCVFGSFVLLVLVLCFPPLARADYAIDCFLYGRCHYSHPSSNPSSGGEIKINPSAVPTEEGFGVEGIIYSDEVDFALVQGLGRVGAAISPANSEETFFGPPGFETQQDYLERHIEGKKYPNQKYTVATAIKLLSREGSGLGAYSFKLGLMGKYNIYTNNVSPGAGLSGTVGPLTFGISYYKDETQLETYLDKSLRPPALEYNVQTYNVGLYLSSVIFDYSYLLVTQDMDVAEVNLYTGTLLLKNFIFTLSKRIEKSSRPYYNPATQSLEAKEIKEQYFGGLQYYLDKNIIVGVLHNYYLLNEQSVMVTVFF